MSKLVDPPKPNPCRCPKGKQDIRVRGTSWGGWEKYCGACGCVLRRPPSGQAHPDLLLALTIALSCLAALVYVAQ